jgi:TIR domain
MAGKIFINYRRDDSIAIAGRLHDRLAETFGRDNLFMDVDNIPVGINFEEYLNNQVAQCDAMLSVIGPNWLNAKDETDQRRLDKPDDFVAIEITAALARNILVIPVLVDSTHMPKASELPASLKPLALRNAIQVRNTNFGNDAEQLITKMREAVALGRAERPQDPVTLTYVAHLVATFLLNIGVFLVALTIFFFAQRNYAGFLAAFLAGVPFFPLGKLLLTRDQSVRFGLVDQSVRRFGLLISVGGLLAVTAILVSGQFLGVGLFEGPDLQAASAMIFLQFIFTATFFGFGAGQYAKGVASDERMQKVIARAAYSLWFMGLAFLGTMMFVSAGTSTLLYRLTDSTAAVLALVGAQLLVVGVCFVRYRKALAANPAPAQS